LEGTDGDDAAEALVAGPAAAQTVLHAHSAKRPATVQKRAERMMYTVAVPGR
jgi:hypothetical protein